MSAPDAAWWPLRFTLTGNTFHPEHARAVIAPLGVVVMTGAEAVYGPDNRFRIAGYKLPYGNLKDELELRCTLIEIARKKGVIP